MNSGRFGRCEAECEIPLEGRSWTVGRIYVKIWENWKICKKYIFWSLDFGVSFYLIMFKI